MGRANAQAAFALWPELDHGPFRLLVGMALRALDPPGGKDGRPPFLYYDGEDGLVQITGRSRTATYRLLDVLREKGAVELQDAGRLGHKAVYKVVVNASVGVAKRRASVPMSGTLKRPDGRYTKGPDERDMKGPDERDTKEDEGQYKEDGEGNGSVEVTTSLAAELAAATKDESDSDGIEVRNRKLIEKHGLVHALRVIEGGKSA